MDKNFNDFFKSIDPKTPWGYGMGNFPYRPSITLPGTVSSAKKLYLFEKERAENLRDKGYLIEADRIKRSYGGISSTDIERDIFRKNCPTIGKFSPFGSLNYFKLTRR